jgi:hypothetical protein
MAAQSRAWVLAAWILGSWVRIPLNHGCLSSPFLCCVVLLDRGLATGWPPVQGVLPNVEKTRLRNLTYMRPRRFSKNRRVTGKKRTGHLSQIGWTPCFNYLVCFHVGCCILPSFVRCNVQVSNEYYTVCVLNHNVIYYLFEKNSLKLSKQLTVQCKYVFSTDREASAWSPIIIRSATLEIQKQSCSHYQKLGFLVIRQISSSSKNDSNRSCWPLFHMKWGLYFTDFNQS